MRSLPRKVCVVVAVLSSSAFADKMYWMDRGNDTVQFANRDGTNRGSFAVGTFGAGVAVDALRGHVYWSENGPDKVRRANLDGSNAIDVLTSVVALDLALDVHGGKIYWSEDDFGASVSRIRRANLNGTGPETIVTITGGTAFVSGIAVDVPGNKVYWVEFLNGKVKRANLDGTSVQELVTSGGNVIEIALDTTNGKMYWGTCGGLPGIRRANLDGTGAEPVIPGAEVGGLCAAGIDVDSAGGKLYWVDQNTPSIHRSNLDGTSGETLVSTTIVSPSYISLDVLPVEIPAASTWGLTVLSLTLLVGGTCILRGRRSMGSA